MNAASGSLQDQIRTALNDREQHEAWSRWLLTRQRSLHRNIMLPEGYRTSTLINFTRSYLMRLPEMLDYAEKAADKHRLTTCATLIDICRDYMASAPGGLQQEGGLIYSWLVRTYVGHRLLEEMQDWAVNACGENLLPLDNTRANLLAHELLGEDFCAQLETTIQTLCQVLQLEDTHTLHQRRLQYHQPPCMLANAMATLWLDQGIQELAPA